MIIPNYTVTEKIHEGRKTNIYKGYRTADRLPVVFKFLKDPYPSLLDIAKLKYEYEIAKTAKGSGVIDVCDIAHFENTPVLILEYFGGQSLKSFIKSRKPDLHLSMQLSVKLAEILSHIHSKGIIHKDINPNNILIDPETTGLKSSTLRSPRCFPGKPAYWRIPASLMERFPIFPPNRPAECTGCWTTAAIIIPWV